MVVIDNVLSEAELRYARENIKALRSHMGASVNDTSARHDKNLSVRESDRLDGRDHGDALVHCIRLLRGIPYLLGKFDYSTSHSHIVPRQCQLTRCAAAHPQKNGKGEVYVRHLDRTDSTLQELREVGLLGWLRASDTRGRVVTSILYLNARDWDGGGELRLFDSDSSENAHRDVIPSGGKLILFDSSKVEHQVLAAIDEDRYALTCWTNGLLH